MRIIKERANKANTEVKKSQNIKKGKFNESELHLYGLDDKEIEVILSYQKLLPILQEENNATINARDLHDQLGVKKDFSDWIKLQLLDLDAIVYSEEFEEDELELD